MSTEQQKQQPSDQDPNTIDAENYSTSEPTAAVIESVLGGAGAVSLHNFPGTPQQQWRNIAIAEGPGIGDATSLGDKPFPMTYFYAHKVTIVNDKTGEITEPTRVVLLDKNMRGVAFVSDGIAKALGKIIQIFGMKPYDPPIMVKVANIKTRRKLNTYTLVPAE